MNINFNGISTGHVKGNTLDKAFAQAQVRVEASTGLSFSQEDTEKAKSNLSPITSGGLDNCLQAFAKNLISISQSKAA